MVPYSGMDQNPTTAKRVAVFTYLQSMRGKGGHRYGELMAVDKKMREDAYGSGQLIQSRLDAANHR